MQENKNLLKRWFKKISKYATFHFIPWFFSLGFGIEKQNVCDDNCKTQYTIIHWKLYLTMFVVQGNIYLNKRPFKYNLSKTS